MPRKETPPRGFTNAELRSAARVALGRRRALWVSFVIAALALVVMLGLQFFWLADLERARRLSASGAIPESQVTALEAQLRAAEAKGLLGTSVEENEKRTPVRRVGRPDDIANAAAFLAADAAGYITGQIIGVNGGRVT